MDEREQLIKAAKEKWEREQLVAQAKEKWAAENQSPEDRVAKSGYIGNALRKFGEGFYGGGYDELAGALETVPNMVKEGKSVGDAYRQGRDYWREVGDEASKQYPITSKAAEFIGALAGPGKYIKGAKSAAAVGGLLGLAGSKADLTKGEVLPAVKDTAEGVVLGGAGYGIAKGGEKIIKKGIEKVAPVMRGGADRVLGKAEPRVDSDELIKAIRTVSPTTEKVPAYLLTQPGSMQQKVAGHLVKSPTIGGKLVRDELSPIMKGLDDFGREVSDLASDKSAYEAGDAVKKGLLKEFSEKIKPAEKAYSELEDTFAKTPLNYLGLKRGIGALRREFKTDFTGASQRLLDQIEATVLPQIDPATGKLVGGLKNVGELKQFRTNLGKYLGGNPSDIEREIVNRVYGVATRERDRSILANSISGASKIGRKARAQEVLGQTRGADKIYKEVLGEVGDALGIEGSRRNSQSGLIRDYITNTPNEQVVKQLFNKNDVGRLKSLKKSFPVEFDELRRQHLSEIVSRATHNGQLSTQKLSTALSKLPKETKDLLLGATKTKAEAVEKVLSALPTLNPSDTATKMEIGKLLNIFQPGDLLDAWSNNAASILQRRAIGKSGLGEMPEGVIRKMGRGLLKTGAPEKSVPLGLIQSNQGR